MQLSEFIPTLPDKTGWLNPRTGKGWSDDEEQVIAHIMADESCSRIQAIQAMRRRRKLNREDLSEFETLEYLRQLRGTSKQNLPETQDAQVRLAFGRGYKVVDPSATLEELFSAPAVVGKDAVRVPIFRREQHALVCTKAEADCFSLRWNDVIGGNKVHREGKRLYLLEEATSTVEFLSSEGCDPEIVYRKSQEPIIEYEYVTPEPEPTPIEIAVTVPEPERQADPEPAVFEVKERFPLQPVQKAQVLVSTGYEEPKSPVCYGNPQEAASELVAIPPAVRPPKRPIGRPKVWFSETERIADYRRRKKMETIEIETGLNADIPVPEVVSTRPKKPRKKWQSKREPAASTEPHKPLVLPALPEGVYRAREVVTKSSPSSPSTARRNYHAVLQDNRCFFCERLFGIYVQKNLVKPEQLRAEDEHFIPRRLPGSRKDENRHAVCHVCNRLKSDLVFSTEEECRAWLQEAWRLNGYKEVGVHAIRYLGVDSAVLFEERLAAQPTELTVAA